MPDATDIHATNATCLSGGGRQMWFASVLRFCAIAARWLIARLPTHHGKPPPLMSQATESLFAENHEHFFNSIGQFRSSNDVRRTTG
jgi:hypothetical protein